MTLLAPGLRRMSLCLSTTWETNLVRWNLGESRFIQDRAFEATMESLPLTLHIIRNLCTAGTGRQCHLFYSLKLRWGCCKQLQNLCYALLWVRSGSAPTVFFSLRSGQRNRPCAGHHCSSEKRENSNGATTRCPWESPLRADTHPLDSYSNRQRDSQDWAGKYALVLYREGGEQFGNVKQPTMIAVAVKKVRSKNIEN